MKMCYNGKKGEVITLFEPRYSITPNMAKKLMNIQAANTLVEQLPLPANVLSELQRESSVRRVILSTKIEGTALDERQMREAIHAQSPKGEEQEVVNLWKAMEYLDQCANRRLPLTEDLIKKLHAIIQVISGGRRPKISEYRTQQNAVKNMGTDRKSVV
jgi:Fic family protein